MPQEAYIIVDQSRLSMQWLINRHIIFSYSQRNLKTVTHDSFAKSELLCAYFLIEMTISPS